MLRAYCLRIPDLIQEQITERCTVPPFYKSINHTLQKTFLIKVNGTQVEDDSLSRESQHHHGSLILNILDLPLCAYYLPSFDASYDLYVVLPSNM